MATQYPIDIDNNNTLPSVVDGISPVVARDHNNLKEAIIAIQTELGKNPSDTFGNVKARLEDLTNKVNNMQLTVPVAYKDTLTIQIEEPIEKDYYLLYKANFTGIINKIQFLTIAGDVTFNLIKNSTIIHTGLVGSTVEESNTEEISVAIDDIFILRVTSVSSPSDLILSLNITIDLEA